MFWLGMLTCGCLLVAPGVNAQFVLREANGTARQQDGVAVRAPLSRKTRGVAVRLDAHYMYLPLEVSQPSTGVDDELPFVDRALFYELSAAYAVTPGVDIRLSLSGPFAQHQPGAAERQYGDIDSIGFSDPIVGVLLHIADFDDWRLGIAANIGIPLGTNDSFSTWDAATTNLTVQLGHESGPWRVFGEVGPRFRPNRQWLDYRMGTDLAASVAAVYRVGERLEAGVECLFVTGLETGRALSASNTRAMPSFFGRFRVGPPWTLGVHAGFSLTDGVGSPGASLGVFAELNLDALYGWRDSPPPQLSNNEEVSP